MQWSADLAKRLYESNWKPDIIVGLYRGGVFPAIVIQDYLRSKGIKSIHFPLVCSSYDEDAAVSSPKDECIVRLQELDKADIINLFKLVKRPLNVLAVDDIYDTGKTMCAVKKTFDNFALESNDSTIFSAGILSFNFRTACVCWKPSKSSLASPNWWIREVEDDVWTVFPHEFTGLTEEELENKAEAEED